MKTDQTFRMDGINDMGQMERLRTKVNARLRKISIRRAWAAQRVAGKVRPQSAGYFNSLKRELFQIIDEAD
ncbi:hypothetical protein [Pusillimonas noertemannii]|uniref:Uncharacterized protein n=1 Tax=Pusillimonas noertemannii TaxID=305977 RepID=A0A2U1CMP8_9BURK|nr:hypothetical protein [Pusillimonas noertemannii]NYT68701.1 hypothetical protein [Pusillimonas noertemannii]PVY62280.1 hypothetical protein C7440_1773 [Pusillimonas noertemannii]TFL10744.1 hypothetical protein CSC72_09495 [Pusillimonas noertemannii]